MSGSIKLKHASGNGVIIAAPSSNPSSDKTINLPSDETGVFATKDSNDSLQNISSVNGGQLGGRNLLVNGDMRINQRFGSASMNATNGNLYSLDRWVTSNDNATSRFTVQQVEDAPVGFYYSLKATSSSAHTPASGEVFGFSQKIEGYNTNWLEFGTSNAKSITISFFVKSSLTGTFGGSVLNNGMTRGFPFTYTISSANTWEKKSVTVIGCPDGTWDPASTTGIRVHWSMGAHANRSDTAGQWSSTTYTFHPTGATNVVATNGATLQVTGCQVEEGNTATSFEHRSIGLEYNLCRRYFYKIQPSTTYVSFGVGTVYSSTQAVAHVTFPVPLRASPTFSYNGATNNFYDVSGNFSSFSAIIVNQIMGTSITGYSSCKVNVTGSGTAGKVFMFASSNSNLVSLSFDSEL